MRRSRHLTAPTMRARGARPPAARSRGDLRFRQMSEPRCRRTCRSSNLCRTRYSAGTGRWSRLRRFRHCGPIAARYRTWVFQPRHDELVFSLASRTARAVLKSTWVNAYRDDTRVQLHLGGGLPAQRDAGASDQGGNDGIQHRSPFGARNQLGVGPHPCLEAPLVKLGQRRRAPFMERQELLVRRQPVAYRPKLACVGAAAQRAHHVEKPDVRVGPRAEAPGQHAS